MLAAIRFRSGISRQCIMTKYAQIKNRLPQPLPLGDDYGLAPLMYPHDRALDGALAELHAKPYRGHSSPTGLSTNNGSRIDASFLCGSRIEKDFSCLQNIHDLYRISSSHIHRKSARTSCFCETATALSSAMLRPRWDSFSRTRTVPWSIS